jgi:hypothetical protein
MAAQHCLDCKKDTFKMNEYYMVTKRTWRKANPADKGMLCIGCLEKRLNRKLTLSDFIWCPVNVMNAYDGTFYPERVSHFSTPLSYRLIQGSGFGLYVQQGTGEPRCLGMARLPYHSRTTRTSAHLITPARQRSPRPHRRYARSCRRPGPHR